MERKFIKRIKVYSPKIKKMKPYFLLFLSVFLFSSCLTEDEPSFTPQTEADILKYIEDNNLNATKTDSGLYYVIDNEGTGESPTSTSDVTISYKASFLDGSIYTQSDSDGNAFQLSEIIAGLSEGIQLFKEGGNGILLIPAELGFGDGVVLIFEITLIDVIDNEADILQYISDNNLNAQKTDSGLYYVINNEGTGTRPTASSNVTVAYKGYLLDDTVFDESDSNGISFGLNQVIPGWTEGIQLFKEGGDGVLLIPSNLGYGNSGNSSIPGGAVLVFDVKLISVN